MTVSPETTAVSTDAASVNPSGATGAFFAIDGRCWSRACALGIDAATAYLVLARGTARDNRTTGWSIKAIETYTGIGRKTAGAAIERLLAAGLVDRLAGGTRPRYRLRPAHEVPGTTAYPRQAIFTGEQSAYDRIRESGYLPRAAEKAVPQLIAKGWIVQLADGSYRASPPPNPEPEPIWLPNQLVTGTTTETPPVERVRQTRDALKLRLLVDLYRLHDLPDFGGVDPGHMRLQYRRVRVGEQGPYVVWAFAPQTEQVYWTEVSLPHRIALTPEQRAEGLNDASEWYARTACLADLGLLRWVPHLVEGADRGAAPLHAYSRAGGRRIEDALGAAAHAAGRAMVTEGQFRWACDALRCDAWLAPVLRHIDHVEMIGIARLRYRPHTRLTAAWMARLKQTTHKQLADYRAIADRARLSRVALCA